MGLGCNAAGVTGCRIIDSPRERMVAILTNNFVPCNGRLPVLITLSAVFFASSSAVSASVLALALVLGAAATLAASKLLTSTVLKGMPSSFILELPPFRRPQIGRVIVRSVLDRTLFVLARAAAIAAPAGMLIWLMANISVSGATLLAHSAGFLDPFARVLGLDGVILLAFILGFPANEIVIPIIIMAYTAQSGMVESAGTNVLRELLTQNGWTHVTAVCVMVFTLFHWPCGTTCMSIKKETGSIKWTAVAVALPTLFGMCLCFLIAQTAKIFGV